MPIDGIYGLINGCPKELYKKEANLHFYKSLTIHNVTKKPASFETGFYIYWL